MGTTHLTDLAVAENLTVGGTLTTTGALADTVSLAAPIVNAGASGTTGLVNVYPPTASKGILKISAINNAGAFNTTITNKDIGQATVYSLPDVGAATSDIVCTVGTQTITGVKTLTTPVLGVATATSINGLALTTSTGTLTVPNGVTLTGPATSGTAATLGNAETITGAKTFGSAGAVGKLLVAGTTSGSTILDATAIAAGTLTLPAVTGTLASTTGTNLFLADVKRCSGSVTANGTQTYANVTGLTQTVVPGTYRFRCVLPSTVASGTGGIKYAFHYTTTVLTSIEATGIGMTASAVAVQHTTTTTDVADLFSQAAVVIMTVIEGTTVVGTGGTIDLQMAQNTSNASNSITLVGSSMEFTRIA